MSFMLVANSWLGFGSVIDESAAGIRPLVCLKSNVQLEKDLDGTYEIR